MLNEKDIERLGYRKIEDDLYGKCIGFGLVLFRPSDNMTKGVYQRMDTGIATVYYSEVCNSLQKLAEFEAYNTKTTVLPEKNKDGHTFFSCTENWEAFS